MSFSVAKTNLNVYAVDGEQGQPLVPSALVCDGLLSHDVADKWAEQIHGVAKKNFGLPQAKDLNWAYTAAMPQDNYNFGKGDPILVTPQQKLLSQLQFMKDILCYPKSGSWSFAYSRKLCGKQLKNYTFLENKHALAKILNDMRDEELIVPKFD